MEKPPHREPVVDPTEAPLPAERAFVVQLRAQADPAAGLFVGRAEHIVSGASTRFNSPQDLMKFIAEVLTPAPSSGDGGHLGQRK